MDEATKALIERTASSAATQAVHSTLISLGIDPSEPIEAQKDLATLRELRIMLRDPEYAKDLEHLRRWRVNVEAVQQKGFIAALSFIFLGGVALLLAGVGIVKFPKFMG